MSAPPVTVERVLEALSAHTDFRDGVLGDLAEEFELRADRDGEAAARRWYVAEAVRAAPHLMGDWARGLRKPEFMHLANVVFASFVFAETLLFFFELSLVSVFNLIGVTPVMLTPSTVGPLAPALGLSFIAIGALMGGCIAAWLDDKAPLVSAIALGAVWTCLLIAFAVVSRSTVPAWYPLGAALVMMSGTTFGGVLYLRSGPVAVGRA
jgi:hypothetical protein